MIGDALLVVMGCVRADSIPEVHAERCVRLDVVLDDLRRPLSARFFVSLGAWSRMLTGALPEFLLRTCQSICGALRERQEGVGAEGRVRGHTAPWWVYC
jgi:hypothetical protein